jgi:hypothetical protein
MYSVAKATKAIIFLFAVFSCLSVSAKTRALPMRSVTLEWYPSGDSTIAGYKVHYGTASGQYTHTVSAGDNAVALVTNLVPGNTYYFVVTAFSAAGLESPPSGEISYSVPMPPSGSYNGLFYDDAGVQVSNAGYFSLQLQVQGSYTGKLQLGGKYYSFNGQLSSQNLATNHLTAAGVPLTLLLNVQTDQVTGELTDGSWVAGLQGYRAVYNSKTNAAPFAGTYTIVFPGQISDTTIPMGNGYGSVRVDGNGTANFTGSLADGTKVTQSTPLARDGSWPFCLPLYSGHGLAIGWLSLTNSGGPGGSSVWIKNPGAPGKNYPAGFTEPCTAIGSSYTPPGVMNEILHFIHGRLICNGGDLGAGFTNVVMISNNQAIGPGVSLKFSPSTGTFTGRTTDSAGQTYSFSGAVLQNQDLGYGFLLGPTQSSPVVLTK